MGLVVVTPAAAADPAFERRQIQRHRSAGGRVLRRRGHRPRAGRLAGPGISRTACRGGDQSDGWRGREESAGHQDRGRVRTLVQEQLTTKLTKATKTIFGKTLVTK